MTIAQFLQALGIALAILGSILALWKWADRTVAEKEARRVVELHNLDRHSHPDLLILKTLIEEFQKLRAEGNIGNIAVARIEISLSDHIEKEGESQARVEVQINKLTEKVDGIAEKQMEVGRQLRRDQKDELADRAHVQEALDERHGESGVRRGQQ